MFKSNNYGNFEILDDSDHQEVKIRFVDTGYVTTARRQNVNAGKVVDPSVKAARTAANKRHAAVERLKKEKERRAAKDSGVANGTWHETKRQGRVQVLHYISRHSIFVQFENTGNVIETNRGTLRNKPDLPDALAISTFGVGRIGLGTHLTYENGMSTNAIKTWRAMLRRCYYILPSGERAHPNHMDVTVCEEWLTFQTFATWYEANYPKGGGKYQLDKELLNRGLKIYSPATCRYVTYAQNLAWLKQKRSF